MRLIAVLAALALLAVNPTHAEDAPADDGFFVLFKTAGRVWTLKRVPKPGNEGGDVDTTYLRQEVLAVYKDHAEYGISTSTRPDDASTDNMLVVKAQFKKDDAVFRDPIGLVRIKTESVKTGAGTFDCVKWHNAEGTAMWLSTKFPGLLVRSDDRFGTRELHSFDLLEGDPGYVAPRRSNRRAKPDEADEARLFRKRGRTWLMKASTFKGPATRRTRQFDLFQYEVTAVRDDVATVEVSRLTLLKEKIRGEEPEVLQIKLKEMQDYLEPTERNRVDRTERRKLPGGLFECTVYTYTDADNREAAAWYAKEWPGLVVRRHIKGEEYERIVELVEFSE